MHRKSSQFISTAVEIQSLALLALQLSLKKLCSLRLQIASLPSKLFLSKTRKSQWFIVGAVTLVTMMVVVALSKTQMTLGTYAEPWQKEIFENLKSENVVAINSIISENASSKDIEERSQDYLGFLRNFGDSHGINISAYFIIGLPAGNGVNVTVVNFWRGRLQDISINLNGTAQTIPPLDDMNAATVVFPGVPNYFTVNYTLSEVNATGGTETENSTLTTTKRVFSAIKLRVKAKDESQVWQKAEWN